MAAMDPSPPLAIAMNPSSYRRPFSALDSNAPFNHPPKNDCGMKPACAGIKRKSQQAALGMSENSLELASLSCFIAIDSVPKSAESTIPTTICSSKRPPTYPKRDKFATNTPCFLQMQHNSAPIHRHHHHHHSANAIKLPLNVSATAAGDEKTEAIRILNRDALALIKSEPELGIETNEAAKRSNTMIMKEQCSKKICGGLSMLRGMRPGIIRKLRCRGEVRAAIAAMIGAPNTAASCHGRRKCRNGVWCAQKGCEFDKDAENSVAESLETMDVGRMQKKKKKKKKREWIKEDHQSWDSESFGLPAMEAAAAEFAMAGNMIPCWLDLLRMDLKGRLSALKRSRKRVRGVILSAKGSAASSSDGSGESMEMRKWKDFFLQMDDALCSEGDKLEQWLHQVVEMQHLSQSKSSAPPPWQQEMASSCLPSATCRTNSDAVRSSSNFGLPAASASKCGAS